MKFNEINAECLDEVMELLANADVTKISINSDFILHTVEKLPDPLGDNKASLRWSIRLNWRDDPATDEEKMFFRKPMGFPRTYFFYGAFFKEFLAFVDLVGVTIDSFNVSKSPNFDPELHQKLMMWRHVEASQC